MAKTKTKWIEDGAVNNAKLNADVSGVGLAGGAGSALTLNWTDLTDSPSADDADLIAIYDDSLTAYRKQTRANFLAGLTNYWKKTGTLLEPVTAGDRVQVSISGAGEYAIDGRTSSGTGRAVYGYSSSASGYCGYFQGGRFELAAGGNVNLKTTSGALTVENTTGATTVKGGSGGNLVLGARGSTNNYNETGQTSLKSGLTSLVQAHNKALHDSIDGEINAITEKTTIVDADLILIEDSAATNAKKKIKAETLHKINMSPASDHSKGDNSPWTVDQVDDASTAIGNLVYSAADGNWERTNSSAKMTATGFGIAMEAGSGSKKILLPGGVFRDDSYSWTPNGILFPSSTAGVMSHTPPATATHYAEACGYAKKSNIAILFPSLLMVKVK